VLGGWLTDGFGWQSVFWINPPLALAAVAILVAVAPQGQYEGDRRERRRFDVIGAVLLAAALAAIAWALSRIGPGEDGTSQAMAQPMPGMTAAAAGLGLAGLVAYAMWERTSAHPMTPPRLAKNRPFF